MHHVGDMQVLDAGGRLYLIPRVIVGRRGGAVSDEQDRRAYRRVRGPQHLSFARFAGMQACKRASRMAS